MGGVVNTEKRTWFIQKHIWKGMFKSCEDVLCKMTVFEETNANDFGCAKVKVAILHGRSYENRYIASGSNKSNILILTTPDTKKQHPRGARTRP